MRFVYGILESGTVLSTPCRPGGENQPFSFSSHGLNGRKYGGAWGLVKLSTSEWGILDSTCFSSRSRSSQKLTRALPSLSKKQQYSCSQKAAREVEQHSCKGRQLTVPLSISGHFFLSYDF